MGYRNEYGVDVNECRVHIARRLNWPEKGWLWWGGGVHFWC